jgi:hypothetical protein
VKEHKQIFFKHKKFLRKGGQIFYRRSLFVYIDNRACLVPHRSLTSQLLKSTTRPCRAPTLTAAAAAIHPLTTPLIEEDPRLCAHWSSEPITSMVQMALHLQPSQNHQHKLGIVFFAHPQAHSPPQLIPTPLQLIGIIRMWNTKEGLQSKV